MNIRQMILDTINKKSEVKSADIVKKTGFSRQYVYRFFHQLLEEGKIRCVGKSNRARYVLATEKDIERAKDKILGTTRLLKNKNLKEDIVLDQIRKQTGILRYLKKNVSEIIQYAFSEMLNNAIEHSQSQTVKIEMHKDETHVFFVVLDKGIGIFRNIMSKKKLKTVLAAIQDLLKGKETTSPKRHSGEGIFFTSKAADFLTIQSGKKKIIFDNLLDEIFIKDVKRTKGTRVAFSLNTRSRRNLSDVFSVFTGPAMEFDRTRVTARLYRIGTFYMSRSHARRILHGLQKFKTIILDFRRVETVGQGFADEIFRVWKRDHPGSQIKITNANENVLFMIERAKK